ncbi:MFS transporter, partial [Saccharothrix coeruleofusca]
MFASGEFRALFLAQLLSVLGDQLARVAVSVLVYERTASAGLTAVTYGLTYVPDLVSGPLLSGFADRYPRRAVMITTDLCRGGLVAVMALPGLPLWCAAVLLVLVQALNAPHGAARAATLAAAMRGDRFVVASGVQDVMVQTSQVLGFATGGAVVAVAGTSQGLLLDGATFLLSAVLVRLGVRHRPAPLADAAAGAPAVWSWWHSLGAGLGLVLRDRRLRSLVALACVAGFYITVEGLAVPYAGEIGQGATAVGLLLAASPAGTVVGMLLLTKLPPRTRLRWLGPLAVAACLPLVLCAWRPGLAATVALWALSGAASGYHMVARAAFVQAVPDRHRGQCLGL